MNIIHFDDVNPTESASLTANFTDVYDVPQYQYILTVVLLIFT